MAQQYESILRKRGMRPDAIRFQVLEQMAGDETFSDRNQLEEKLKQSGADLDSEKIRYVIKRLHAMGLLERQRVPKQNKFLFRLWPVAALQKEFSTR